MAHNIRKGRGCRKSILILSFLFLLKTELFTFIYQQIFFLKKDILDVLSPAPILLKLFTLEIPSSFPKFHSTEVFPLAPVFLKPEACPPTPREKSYLFFFDLSTGILWIIWGKLGLFPLICVGYFPLHNI